MHLFLNIVAPWITFDQPLWLMALEITNSKSMNVVCRLRGFHLLTSFLGSIGKVMECSGISELFQVVYSSATAVHMMSGKAYPRALRAHFLAQSALELITFQFISPLSLIEQLSTYDVDRKYLCYAGNSNNEQFPDEISKYLDANDIKELHTLVEQIEKNKDTTMTSETSLKFCRAIAKCKQYLSETSCRAKLWIQYIHYVNIVKQFIRAERTENWQNHLMVVRQMLNLVLVTAHF